MSDNNNDYGYFNGIGTPGAGTKTLPIQTLPQNKKGKAWIKATMESLYWEATRQMHRNYVFADIRRMTQGEFTYRAVDLEQSFLDTPWAARHAQQLGKGTYIPTHIKHFDFIGIIVNAITGIYDDMDSKYRVDSIDEYSTNEYIRQRTEGFQQYAQAIFKSEIDKMLIANGFNPNQTEFKSEEEKQQYQAQLDQEVKRYTPEEVEKNLSKNFKVLATEWATNVLQADEKRFNLGKEDRKALVDFILTGRWFRHYKVGYDYYSIEYWRPEEVFFSQDVDIEYPQDADYIGRLTRMSTNQLLQRYGHLMTTKIQEKIGNYWNQSKNYENQTGEGSNTPFAQARLVPFKNYYDHQINLQMESALGVPLARSMDEKGNVSREWMPRQENSFTSQNSAAYSAFLRDDIDVRTDSIEVMDVYFRSMKRIAILITRNELGSLEVNVTTDDLLTDFLEEEEIKKLTNVSLQELQEALKTDNLEEYVNTISYHYVPEIWHGVMIKGNSSTIKDDIFLDVRPLDYQIKGDSNLFDVRIPVGGIITNGIVPKILPYQQLHNICMNQNSDLLAKEARLGVFFSIDINALPAEYKDETTEEALYAIGDTIQDTGFLPTDPSRSNTQGSTVYPNLFQRNEVTFANQITYRKDLAQFYKQEAFNQVGITPQMLGAPNTYQTAEGVKQGAQASFALMNSLIENFNTSKAKSNELHLAIAQYCETNGKETTKLTRKPDHLLHFIDILAEDEELFPLRKLSVIPASNSRDRKIVEAIQQILMNDNTLEKSMENVVDILCNPYTLELREIAIGMRERSDEKLKQQQAFEAEQLDKQIASEQAKIQAEFAHEDKMERLKGEFRLEEEKINAFGRAALSDDPNANFDRIERTTQFSIENDFTQQGLDIKREESVNKNKLTLEQKKIELEKIKRSREELQLKRETNQVNERISIRNKN